MSVRPDPVIPETRRRRASTTEKSERILKMSRSLTLTRSVLAGTLAEATPNQLDFIERWFTAELDSRERSKRLRLLKQAGFPADKTLDGYDWTNLKMPADWGRAQLENLDFVAGCEDLVLYGPVGTGKSHLAIAIGRLACERGVPVRFFTACLCSISCCGFSHDDFSGLGRACRPRNGLNWMVLVSPPERTGKDYDQHAPSTVYPSFAAERGIRRVDRAENTCQRADGA